MSSEDEDDRSSSPPRRRGRQAPKTRRGAAAAEVGERSGGAQRRGGVRAAPADSSSSEDVYGCALQPTAQPSPASPQRLRTRLRASGSDGGAPADADALRAERFLAMRLVGGGGGEGGEGGREYLVKYEGLAHVHCAWLAEAAAARLNARKLKNAAEGRGSGGEPWSTVDQRNWSPQRVCARRPSPLAGEHFQYLVKWDGDGTGLGYDLATWEGQKGVLEQHTHLIDALALRDAAARARASPQHRALAEAARAPQHASLLRAQPPWLPGGPPPPDGVALPTLMPHQVEALNFLRASYHADHSVILADEMGLGKTVSALAYMRSLQAEYHSQRPCLAVVPLSTLANWAAEARVWAPTSNVVVLHGPRAAREVISKYELWLDAPAKAHTKKVIKADIVLTTYEMVIADPAVFRAVAWEGLVLDEGHRLKAGPSSRGFESLASLNVRHKVLLTGTPVQNNLEELFNLLHFLSPVTFPSFEAFTTSVADKAAAEPVAQGDATGGRAAALLALAAPHMLRRVKKDVLTKLPPRRELHVPVDLSPLQAEWYRAMLTKNYALLAGRDRASKATQLHNIVVQLRKVSNHPYLIHDTEPLPEPTPPGGDPDAESSRIAALRVLASGKLTLLDAMLPMLRERGHRVLVFSQMVRMLDVLEDYARSRFGTEAYERVDGGVLAAQRQAAISRFNAPDSSCFLFLLSTRACGLGINLATADTVIIFDSDWNPHADLQAMSRAHRIGQTRSVAVFRLFTRGTVEERILAFAKRKMALDNVFKGYVKATGEGARLLQDVLRWGADELFAEEAVAADAEALQAFAKTGDASADKAAKVAAEMMAKYGSCLTADRDCDADGAPGRPQAPSRKRIAYDEASVAVLLDSARATLREDGAWEAAVDATCQGAEEDDGGLGTMRPQMWVFDEEDAPAEAADEGEGEEEGEGVAQEGPPEEAPGAPDPLPAAAADAGEDYWGALLAERHAALEAAAAEAAHAQALELGDGGGGLPGVRLRERRRPMGSYAFDDEAAELEEGGGKRRRGGASAKDGGKPTGDGWGLAADDDAGDWTAAQVAAEQRRQRKRDKRDRDLSARASAGGATAAPAGRVVNRAAPQLAFDALNAARPLVAAILHALGLPPALADYVIQLGSYLLLEEPQASQQGAFAQPTLLALALIAADTAGADLGERRSPAALGALFSLDPVLVQAYCSAVHARLQRRLTLLAATPAGRLEQVQVQAASAARRAGVVARAALEAQHNAALAAGQGPAPGVFAGALNELAARVSAQEARALGSVEGALRVALEVRIAPI